MGSRPPQKYPAYCAASPKICEPICVLMKTARPSTRIATSRTLRPWRPKAKGRPRRTSDERQSLFPSIQRICKLCKHSLSYELLPCLRNSDEISRLHVFLRRADLGNPAPDLRQVPSHYTRRPTTSSIANKLARERAGSRQLLCAAMTGGFDGC